MTKERMQVNEVVAIDTLMDDNPEVARRITGLARLKSAQTEFHFVHYTTIATKHMRIVVAITLKQTLVIVSLRL